MYVLGPQKNHLIQTVLLRTHNTCFGLVQRKIIFNYTLLLGKGLGGGGVHEKDSILTNSEDKMK